MSLIAWYPLNGDIKNQGIGDITPSATTNTSTYETGKLNKSLKLSNTNFTIPLNINTANGFTITLWFKPNSSGAWSDIFTLKPTLDRLEKSSSDAHYWYSNSNGILTSGTSLGTFTNDIWYHFAITTNGSETKVYVNGQLKTSGSVLGNYTITSAVFGNRGSNNQYYSGNLNDIRIYDEYLSAKEISEIAKCKILHYPLNDYDGIRAGNNLVTNGNFKSTYTTSSSNKHPNINATSWGGYNSGITNPTTSWHAHVDSDTFGYNVIEFNESDGTRNWKGISHDITSVFSVGKTYNLSLDLYCTGNAKIYGGIYYTKVGGTSANFHAGSYYIYGADQEKNKWVRRSVTVPYPTDIDVSKTIRFYLYGYGFSDNSVAYVKDVSLTTNTSGVVPYYLSPRESGLFAEDGIIYDVSGYKNHGSITTATAPVWSKDTKVGAGSYNFGGTNYITSNFTQSLPQASCSFWIKPSSSNGGYSIIASNYNNPASGFWLASNTENSGLWFYDGAYNKASYSLTNDNWYHGCFTYDKGVTKIYLNGELKSTSTVKGTSLNINKLSIGNSYTGSSWNTKQYGNINDFRLYATVLNEEDIKELYQTRFEISKVGKLYCNQFAETSNILSGRNMCEGTSSEYKAITMGQWYVTLKDLSMSDLMTKYNLSNGDILTYSVTMKSAGDADKGVKIRWQKYNSSSDRPGGIGTVLVKGGEATDSIQIPVDSNYDRLHLMITNANSSIATNTTEYYKDLKLEKGKVATPWAPAPEDLDMAADEISYLDNSFNGNGIAFYNLIENEEKQTEILQQYLLLDELIEI